VEARTTLGDERSLPMIRIFAERLSMVALLFESEAKNGADSDFKAFAAKTLPALKEHLKMARDLADGKSVAHQEP
jgi:predicted outer membrane protein